jgi:hypothetical protein
MFYSKTTGGFYDVAIHGNNIPTDAVEIATEEHVALLAAQSVGKVIQADQNGKPVAVDPPKPTATDVWERIKTERDRRKSGGFKVKVGSSNKWFHSDADSRIQHLGLKDKARDLIAGGGAMTDKLTILGQTVKWKTMDGSFVDLSAQVAFDIVAAAGDLDAQLFAAAETHKAAMEASADPASYDFSGGWPKSFGE